MLGGYTAVLDEGDCCSMARRLMCSMSPARCALRVLSVIRPSTRVEAAATAQGLYCRGVELTLPRPLAEMACAHLTVGVRASALRVQARPGDVAVQGTVELAEISGSDTFCACGDAPGRPVAQVTGVHYFELGPRSRCISARSRSTSLAVMAACCGRPSVRGI